MKFLMLTENGADSQVPLAYTGTASRPVFINTPYQMYPGLRMATIHSHREAPCMFHFFLALNPLHL